MRVRPAAVLLSAVLIAGLTACSAPDDPSADGVTTVVASTNVYGDLAATIGGEALEVTSIIDDPAQDPHSFEGSARVQLALATADIVIENGGGYDDWAATMLAGARNESAVVLSAAQISGHEQSAATGDVNEHLWYDLPTVRALAGELVDALAAVAPGDADDFAANGAALDARLAALEDRAAELSAVANGAAAAITEPVPGYLLAASGFTVVTSEAFSEAIEEGRDVPPAVLEETLGQFAAGDVRVLVYNEQTTGAETELVLEAATAAGVPVVPVGETLPEDTRYTDWIAATLDALEQVVR